MRIVEKMLYGFGGLLALVLFFILLCHFNPKLAQQMGNSIANNQEKTQSEVPIPTPSDTAQEIDLHPKMTDLINVSAVTSADDDGITTIPSSGGIYTPPDEGSLKIPAGVAGLSGLIPIEEKGISISENKSEELQKTLGVGNTGDGLIFDAALYPYYHMLNDTGKALYRQIYANARDLNRCFAPVEAVSTGVLRNAFQAVCNDHPELFWMNTAYAYQYAPNGRIAEIDLSFHITATQIDSAKASFNAAAKRIKDKTYGVYTDYEKEVIVHDALLDAIVYDSNAPMNQSAYSALVNGRTVCAGYARAFQYIMQQLGVPCYYVAGYAGENHAWNIIQLEDGYYNVDATWDDTNPNTHDYFNRTDADYAKDHARRDLSVYLPPCNGQKYRGREEKEPVQTGNVIPINSVVTEKPSAATTTSSQTTTTEPDTQTQGTTTTQTRITTYAYNNASVVDGAIFSLEDYYLDCLNHLLESNSNSVTFSNVVADEKVWNSIVKAYEKGSYEEGYATRVLVERHMGKCTVDIIGTLQSDGTYLVKHTFTMQ